MIRWPGRKVCSTSGIVNLICATSPGLNGSGFSKLFRILAAERLAADELLVAAHLHLGRVRIRIRVIVRVDVDELHHPVRVGAGRADVESTSIGPAMVVSSVDSGSGRRGHRAACAAKRWSAVMYSRSMPMPILLMNGTGFAGSEMYSSKAGAGATREYGTVPQ